MIASGGAGTPQHLVEAVIEGRADAVLLASMLHYGEYTVAQLKDYLAENGVAVRPVK